jgi:hypothetical protein
VLDLRPLAVQDMPGRRVTLDFVKDSVRVAVDSGGSTRRDTYPAPADASPLLTTGFGSSFGIYASYALYELLFTRPGFQLKDSTEVPFIGTLSARVGTKRFQRRSPSLIDVDFFGIAWTHLTTDASGRILAADGNGTTEQIKTQRTGPLDVSGAAKRFADRDRAGKGIGIASPGDSVVATLGPAHLRIDYSSPRRRGRTILGAVVPYDQVWRTGANAATMFYLDRPLTIGTTVVPVGGYSVWTRPSATGVELILNKQTGQWGTEYNPARDFAHIPMQVSTESDPRENFTIAISGQGSAGELRILWDTFVWRVAVKVN